ncbi:Hypothetical predicted protein [Podarcis lilfordi]|uniref:Uncharacterized protein n=1 Tax=Podarcis lilfordi TaxID=74358 RepID=A0AA35PBB2_9SAUR|nr:Hypothetical predicted protein [Podarcis lilfordi]
MLRTRNLVFFAETPAGIQTCNGEEAQARDDSLLKFFVTQTLKRLEKILCSFFDPEFLRSPKRMEMPEGGFLK